MDKLTSQNISNWWGLFFIAFTLATAYIVCKYCE